jgi:non-homologous end joining protein Ku
VRNAGAFLTCQASPGPDLRKLAEHISSLAGDFDPASFRDADEEALLAHLKAKQAGAVRFKRCRAGPGHQSDGGAAPQHRAGP